MTNKQLVKVLEDRGLQNAQDIIDAFNQGGGADDRIQWSLAAVCATVQDESGGRNVFGDDPAGDALPRMWFGTPVTHTKYVVYRWRRNHGMTPNGVGPCQLTSASLQIEAEKLGGCWKPIPNMLVGFHFLKELFIEHGSARLGYQFYNGSGPDAVAYGIRLDGFRQQWQGWINAAT
jgi:hypothetical protein